MFRGFAFLLLLGVRVDPIAATRPENMSCIPRVSLAQSSRASILYSPRDSVASDRLIFEQASAGFSLGGTVRCCLAGVRRYTPYIIALTSGPRPDMFELFLR